MFPLPNLQAIAVALAFGLIAGAGPAWYWTATYKDASWRASVQRQEIIAEQKLREAIEHTMAVERAQRLMISALEEKHNAAETMVNNMRRDNLELATRLGGLRDPGRRESRQCPVPGAPADASIPEDPSTGTALSAEATRFLLGLAVEADEAALYAGACYGWAQVVEPPTIPDQQ